MLSQQAKLANMLKFLFSTSLIFNFFYVSAILRRADIIKTHNNQYIVLLHDQHNVREGSATQLITFWKNLQRCNSWGKQLNLLVEIPENLTIKKKKYPTVLTHIAKIVENNQYQNINVQSLENNLYCHGALYLLLNNDLSHESGYLYNIAGKECVLNSITLSDVLNELSTIYNDISIFIKNLDCPEQKVKCLEELNRSLNHFQFLTKYLDSSNIDLNESVYNLKSNPKDNFKPALIAKIIISAFTPLFNVHILGQLKNITKLTIVVAGALHMDTVRFLLLQDKNNKLVQTTKDSWDGSVLTLEDINQIFDLVL